MNSTETDTQQLGLNLEDATDGIVYVVVFYSFDLQMNGINNFQIFADRDDAEAVAAEHENAQVRKEELR